jgi:hypothetical protein
MQPMGTGWTLAGSGGISITVADDVEDLSVAAARINAPGAPARASVDSGIIRIEAAQPAHWSGIPAYYGPRPRFEGRMVHGSNGERTLEGWIIRSDAVQAFTLLGELIALVVLVAGVLVVADGDPAGLLIVAASAVFAGAMLVTLALHQRLYNDDSETLIDSLNSLGGTSQASA